MLSLLNPQVNSTIVGFMILLEISSTGLLLSMLTTIWRIEKDFGRKLKPFTEVHKVPGVL